MKYLFVGVLAFAAGVVARDQAQDVKQVEAQAVCERAIDNADRFARALAAALNGGAFHTDDVRVSCRVTPIRKETQL